MSDTPLPPHHPADELLSRGGVSGPRMDHVWNRLESALDADDKARAVARRRARWGTLLGLSLAGATALLLVVPRSPELQERGEGTAPPRLLATCGAAGRGCAAGEPVFLKLESRAADGVYYVFLMTEDAPVMLAGPLPARSGAIPVPAKVTPGDEDRGTLLRLRALWRPRAEPDAAAAVRALGDAAAVSSVLELVVQP